MQYIKHINNRHIYIMEVNGHAFSKAYTFADDNETIFLELLSVEHQYRNKGYGLRMQEIREQIGIDTGYKYSMLYVIKNSWMVDWYIKRGYEYYQDKGSDEQWMRKLL